MKNNDYTEKTKQESVMLGGFNPIEVIPTVKIPLEEYREFVEFKVKGPTVEIPLEVYDRLKDDNVRMNTEIWGLKDHIRNLQNELERARGRQEEIDKHTDVVTKMVADEITEKVMKDLLQLSEEQKKELRAKWRNVTDSDTEKKGK